MNKMDEKRTEKEQEWKKRRKKVLKLIQEPEIKQWDGFWNRGKGSKYWEQELLIGFIALFGSTFFSINLLSLILES